MTWLTHRAIPCLSTGCTYGQARPFKARVVLSRPVGMPSTSCVKLPKRAGLRMRACPALLPLCAGVRARVDLCRPLAAATASRRSLTTTDAPCSATATALRRSLVASGRLGGGQEACCTQGKEEVEKGEWATLQTRCRTTGQESRRGGGGCDESIGQLGFTVWQIFCICEDNRAGPDRHAGPRERPRHGPHVGPGRHGPTCSVVSCLGRAKSPGHGPCPWASGHMAIYTAGS
jgi:hypothetical protein